MHPCKTMNENLKRENGRKIIDSMAAVIDKIKADRAKYSYKGRLV